MKNYFLALVAFLAVAFANAQSADDIIAKHIEAIGGKEKLTAITSVKMENTMQVMGNEAPSTTIILNGKGFRNESEFNGQKMVQVVTDKGGWVINPMTGGSAAQPMPAEQFKAGAQQIYVVPFLNYSTRGYKAELVGQEKVGAVNAYKIKLSDKNNSAATYYFDPSTYYIIESVKSAEMMGQQVDVTTTFSDFRKTDYGWVVPQAMDINMGGQFSLSAKVKNVEVNKEVDPKVFDMPAK